MTGKLTFATIVSAARYVAPMLTVAVAAVVSVALTAQARTAKAELRERERALRFPFATQVVPPVMAMALNGDSVWLGPAGTGRPQIVFVLAPECAYCAQVLPTWRQVARDAAHGLAGQVDVIGVTVSSPDSTAAYLEQQGGVEFPVVRLPNDNAYGVYRFWGVPLTVVIAGNGEVVYSRPGAFSASATVDSLVSAARAAVGHVSSRGMTPVN